jgi:23S rRNA (pseudouridine1915-N3)-methyltransferase
MRVEVLWIGKTRLPGVAALTEEYSKRLGRYCDFHGGEVRGNRKSGRAGREEDAMLAQSRESYRVVLDPMGKQSTSAELARFLGALRDRGQRRVTFCVAGADGFSPAFRKEADLLLSLSALTMPHELARVVLLEQLYRSFTMLANHPYPR